MPAMPFQRCQDLHSVRMTRPLLSLSMLSKKSNQASPLHLKRYSLGKPQSDLSSKAIYEGFRIWELDSSMETRFLGITTNVTYAVRYLFLQSPFIYFYHKVIYRNPPSENFDLVRYCSKPNILPN